MIKTNIKMMLTPEESKQVQDICFANGIFWNNTRAQVSHLEQKYLYIFDPYITFGESLNFFKEHSGEEVSAELFIRTNGTCVEETPKQELKQNINKEETMEKNEVESYADVKEYLIAKGLYERVLEIDWETYEEDTFSDLFKWSKTKERHYFWDELNNEMIDLDIYDKVESLIKDYKAKQGKEFIEHIEVQPEEVVETKPTSYTNAKEYLIAKGLYEDVLTFNLDFEGYSKYFGNMFWFNKTPQGFDFWRQIESELVNLEINNKLDEILRDYEIRKLEVTIPTQKPKQYLCYVQGKSLPKHIHKTLEQAKQEAQRLCRKELAKVSVLEVVAEYEAEVVVREVL